MKKILLILSFMALLAARAAFAAEYYLDGWVYAANGASGTAATENSFATMHAYRTGISGHIGTLNAPGRVFPLAGSGLAAFYVTDVGSSDWNGATAAEGDTITAVFEVYAPLFGWAGDSFIASTRSIITNADATNLQTDMSPVQLKAIPTPQVDSMTASQVVLSLIGIDEDYINSYGLYRSTSLAGTYTLIATVAQDRGNSIQYTDASVTAGQDYYYKWNVNFSWGGGAAPAYYSSTAMSVARGPVSAPTATGTFTASPTVTDTSTGTFTCTLTATDTITDSPTMTWTPTATGTGTDTHTATATVTATDSSTQTPTQTATGSGTATNTATNTGTATFTHTSTGTPSVTETDTASPTQTQTTANTETDTPTVTPTVTVTTTDSPTDTVTPTVTVTGTDTITATVTKTITDTCTDTVTQTITPTSTVTLTPAVTDTPTPPVVYEPIAYPQPASNTITFAYKLNTATQVTIYVYNLMGSQVAVFGPYAYAGSPGIYTTPQAPPIDISKFAPGVYFYMVKTNDPGTKFNVQKFLVER